LVETKLAEFKVEEHDSVIQKATLEDVQSYDPKSRRIIAAGRYEIEQMLGRGGLGSVFRGFEVCSGRRVAIKYRDPWSDDDEGRVSTQQNLRQEARILGMLSHPNIVVLHELIEDDNVCIVMEFIEGLELRHLLTGRLQGDLSLYLRILAEIADALDYAHSKDIVHRDVKPASIMVKHDGTAKLIDFGNAIFASEGLGFLGGAMAYMAPEQLKEGRIDGRADQFALAAVAYEILTGQLPWSFGDPPSMRRSEELQSPRHFNPALGSAVEQVLFKALSNQADRRFRNCTDFVIALATAIKC
jgi:serine/threonine-protein kinase